MVQLLRFSSSAVLFPALQLCYMGAIVISKVLLILCSEEVTFSKLLFCSLFQKNSWVMSSVRLVSHHS